MCNDQPGDANRRSRSLAELLDSCARMFRAALACGPERVEDAANATHGLAYQLEHQPNTQESTTED